MRCPACENEDTKVVDSRPAEEGAAIRRRRECDKCEFRFSTYEEMEILDLSVLKRGGTVENYSREKLERGLRRSFEKVEHAAQVFKKLVSAIELDIQKKSKNGQITSQDIGEIIMKRLKRVSKVAYIRFASVYRQFEDVQDFKLEIEKLTEKSS